MGLKFGSPVSEAITLTTRPQPRPGQLPVLHLPGRDEPQAETGCEEGVRE